MLSANEYRVTYTLAISNKNIIYLSVWNWRIALSCTWFSYVLLQLLPTLSLFLLYGQATQRLHCQVHVSEFFYPVEFNRAKKPMLEDSAWITLHFHSPGFSELNKALDTNEYNRTKSQSDLSSARNILFARITSNEPVCFEGWNKFSVPIWSPWEPNLTHRRSGCQLGLLSINFDFRNVIFQPIVFPFVWAKYKWNFMRDRCKLSFPLPLAASPLARAFSRDSLHSPN